MSVVIIAVLVVSALIAGHFLIRRIIRSTVKEREHQLDVARGKVQEAPAKPKKKKRQGWRFSALPPVPELIEIDLEKRVPAIVHAYLQSRHRLTELAAALGAAQLDYDACLSQQTAALAKAEAAERPHFQVWFDSASESILRARQSARVLIAANSAYSTEIARHNKAWDTLRDWVQETWTGRSDRKDKWDVEGLDDDKRRTLRIARRVFLKGEYSYAPQPGVNLNVPTVSARVRPDTDVRDDFLVGAQAPAKALYDVIAAAEEMRARIDDEGRTFRELAKPADIAAPARPSESDVQPFIEQWLAWAQAVNAAQVRYHALLAPLEAAIGSYKPHCEQLSSSIKDCESLSDAEFARADVYDFLARNWRARLDLLGRTHQAHNHAMPFATAAEAEGIDGKGVTNLQAQLRKLGFAVAQRDAAAAKLKQIEEAKVEPPYQVEPKLGDETLESTEHLVRAVRQWKSETTRVQTQNAQRNERLQEQRQQLSERQRQLQEALAAIAKLVQDLTAAGSPVPAEPQYRFVRVANTLRAWLEPPAPPAPAATQSSSSSSRDKKKKKRR